MISRETGTLTSPRIGWTSYTTRSVPNTTSFIAAPHHEYLLCHAADTKFLVDGDFTNSLPRPRPQHICRLSIFVLVHSDFETLWDPTLEYIDLLSSNLHVPMKTRYLNLRKSHGSRVSVAHRWCCCKGIFYLPGCCCFPSSSANCVSAIPRTSTHHSYYKATSG